MSEFNYESIDQYLSGELSGAALEAFEKEMQDNPELVREISIYKTIEADQSFQVQNKAEKEKLQKTLTTLNETHFAKPAAKVIKMNRWWYAAAAVAAAVILIVVLRPFSSEEFNNEKLFAYYTKDVESLSAGQRGNNEDTLALTAVNLFNKKDYAEALPILQSIVAVKPDETDLQLATGICLMQTTQTDAALLVFNKIANGNTVYKNKAVWYKALALLKQNKVDECYRVLQTLPADADNYKEAAELMKKIKGHLKNL